MIITGDRVVSRVLEWAFQHTEELMEDWRRRVRGFGDHLGCHAEPHRDSQFRSCGWGGLVILWVIEREARARLGVEYYPEAEPESGFSWKPDRQELHGYCSDGHSGRGGKTLLPMAAGI